MITEVAVVPSAPLLLSAYTGRDDAGAQVRAYAVGAVRDALSTGVDEVVILATSARGPGGQPPGGISLGLRIGREILALAGGFGDVAGVHVSEGSPLAGEVTTLGEELASRPGRVLLLVVADGSARRDVKAPGHLDDRAFAVDDQWVSALRDGDPDPLLALDVDLCTELLVTGRAALQTMAIAVAESDARIRPELVWAGDPFGVMYAVARWRLDRPAPNA